jgi:hypothetical protein
MSVLVSRSACLPSMLSRRASSPAQQASVDYSVLLESMQDQEKRLQRSPKMPNIATVAMRAEKMRGMRRKFRFTSRAEPG